MQKNAIKIPVLKETAKMVPKNFDFSVTGTFLISIFLIGFCSPPPAYVKFEIAQLVEGAETGLQTQVQSPP